MKLLETGVKCQMKIFLANYKHLQKSTLGISFPSSFHTLFHEDFHEVHMPTCRLALLKLGFGLKSIMLFDVLIRMGGVTIVQKGKTDYISDGKTGVCSCETWFLVVFVMVIMHFVGVQRIQWTIFF